MEQDRWEIITGAKLVGFAIGAALFFVLVACSEPGFIFIIDHANLLFHEAGHPFFGFFSERFEPYGGTLGQLVFPAILVVSFWRKGQPLSVAAVGIWFFENLLNISRYIADARALELPLVGGGDHDWNTILHRWNWLAADTLIAAWVKTIGWVGIVSLLIWVGWRAWQDRHRQVESPALSFAKHYKHQ